MSLIGIIAKKKDIQLIRKKIESDNIEIIEITKESIQNLKNIKFKDIIFLKDIKLDFEEYKYMREIITNSQYLIINGDLRIDVLKDLQISKPIKLITFGFNLKATITISSVEREKIIVCIQREIEKEDGKIIEVQEKEIEISNEKSKNIYNNLTVFIIKELHNLTKNT